MLMTNFLRDRKSTREFREKKIDKNKLSSIRKEIGDILVETKGINIGIKLFEDGDYLYNGLKGLAGYTGIMIKSPSYIILEIKDKESRTEMLAAYYMEELITKINDLAVGACWITMKDVDKNNRVGVFGEGGANIEYILAIGYPPLRNPFTSVENTSHRNSVEEFVFSNQVDSYMGVEEMEARGLYELFYYVRYAPSTRNSQPWRFLVTDDKIILLLGKTDGEYSFIDAGVMTYYLKSMANSIGYNSDWEFSDNKEIDDKYIEIGFIRI